MSKFLKIDVGAWVLVHWLSGIDSDCLIYEEDIGYIKELLPSNATSVSSSLFKVMRVDERYITVRVRNNEKSELIKIVPDKTVIKPVIYNEGFDIGDKVSVVGRDYEGKILDINWHYKFEKPIITLEVNGKRKSKRYWPEDLEKINN